MDIFTKNAQFMKWMQPTYILAYSSSCRYSCIYLRVGQEIYKYPILITSSFLKMFLMI